MSAFFMFISVMSLVAAFILALVTHSALAALLAALLSLISVIAAASIHILENESPRDKFWRQRGGY